MAVRLTNHRLPAYVSLTPIVQCTRTVNLPSASVDVLVTTSPYVVDAVDWPNSFFSGCESVNDAVPLRCLPD